MKSRFHFLVFLAFLIIMSCQNDDPGDIQLQDDPVNYYALKVGNTWKFQYYRRDIVTNEMLPLDAFEINEIVAETQINSKTYFEVRATYTGADSDGIQFELADGESRFVRDSLGYLVHPDGLIRFSHVNPDQEYVLNEDIIYTVYGILRREKTQINVDAGTFDCDTEFVFARSNETGELAPGSAFHYYAQGIGEVFQEYTGITTEEHRWEKRLVEYQLTD